MRQQWVFLHRAIWFKAFIPVKRPRVLRCQPGGRNVWKREKLKGSGLRVQGTEKKERGSVCWKYPKLWTILESSFTGVRAPLCSVAQVSVSSALGCILILSCINHMISFLIFTFLCTKFQKLSHSLKTNFNTPFYWIFILSHCPQRMLFESLLEFLFISYLMWHNNRMCYYEVNKRLRKRGNDLEMRKPWKGIKRKNRFNKKYASI